MFKGIKSLCHSSAQPKITAQQKSHKSSFIHLNDLSSFSLVVSSFNNTSLSTIMEAIVFIESLQKS